MKRILSYIQLSVVGIVIVVTICLAYLYTALTFPQLGWRAPFAVDRESLTKLLSFAYTITTALVGWLSIQLRIEEFSAPKALALGYVNSLIKPVAACLPANYRLYIYIPETVNELNPGTVQAVKNKLTGDGFVFTEHSVITGVGKRVLDVAKRNVDGKIVYFDFPRTMDVLRYVVALKGGSMSEAAREKFGKKLIKSFIKAVKSELGISEKSFVRRFFEKVRICESSDPPLSTQIRFMVGKITFDSD